MQHKRSWITTNKIFFIHAGIYNILYPFSIRCGISGIEFRWIRVSSVKIFIFSNILDPNIFEWKSIFFAELSIHQKSIKKFSWEFFTFENFFVRMNFFANSVISDKIGDFSQKWLLTINTFYKNRRFCSKTVRKHSKIDNKYGRALFRATFWLTLDSSTNKYDTV